MDSKQEKKWTWLLLIIQLWPQYKALQVFRTLVVKGEEKGLTDKKYTIEILRFWSHMLKQHLRFKSSWFLLSYFTGFHQGSHFPPCGWYQKSKFQKGVWWGKSLCLQFNHFIDWFYRCNQHEHEDWCGSLHSWWMEVRHRLSNLPLLCFNSNNLHWEDIFIPKHDSLLFDRTLQQSCSQKPRDSCWLVYPHSPKPCPQLYQPPSQRWTPTIPPLLHEVPLLSPEPGLCSSALSFNRGTGSKPDIQCFWGLYIIF